MVLVAGLDRLEGTKVGPWLTDAEWQDQVTGGGGNPCTCYVGSLNWDTKEETLRELFDVYGSVQSVDIQVAVELLTRGFNGTQPTGSAVVQFYSAAAATAAIQDLNGTELNGRRLYVRAYFT